jgi:hypothetical protein
VFTPTDLFGYAAIINALATLISSLRALLAEFWKRRRR